MKAKRIERNDPAKKPTVINERMDNINSAMANPELSMDILRTINKPVRTVVYVEVGDAPSEKVRELIALLNDSYSSSTAGIHYVIPIRYGRISGDMQFEQEFLETIRKICTIDNNQIVFKEDMHDTIVIREKVE